MELLVFRIRVNCGLNDGGTVQSTIQDPMEEGAEEYLVVLRINIYLQA